MTVANNIAFPLKAQGMDAEERTQGVEWAAGLFGIDRLLQRRRQLSGGERQRVALARALVRGAHRVPTRRAALQSRRQTARAAACDDLMEFQRRIRITTIYVTHDQVEAMGMGDRIAVMNQGKVRQLGTPEEVYPPSHRCVRSSVPRIAPDESARDCNVRLRLPPRAVPPRGIAPDEGARVPFTFHVNRIEYLGSERYLYGFVREYDETRVIAMLPATVTLPIGIDQDHKFSVAKDQLRFFDLDSGEKIPPQPLMR